MLNAASNPVSTLTNQSRTSNGIHNMYREQPNQYYESKYFAKHNLKRSPELVEALIDHFFLNKEFCASPS